MSVFLEIINITFPTPSPPPSFSQVVDLAKATPGVVDIYMGHSIEDPSTHHVILHWVSRDAFDASQSSPAYPAFIAAFTSVAATASIFLQASDLGPGILTALNAPCTELVRLGSAQRDWVDNHLAKFAGALRELKAEIEGLHDLGYGKAEAGRHIGCDAPEPELALFILGWDSKEAHEAASALKDGHIVKNHHYLALDTGSQKMLQLSHTKLTKL